MFGDLKFTGKTIATDVIKVMVPSRLWDIPHALPAVMMRMVGIGIAYRELRPSTYHSNYWIARYRELPWHIPKKISQVVVHWKGKTACLLRN